MNWSLYAGVRSIHSAFNFYFLERISCTCKRLVTETIVWVNVWSVSLVVLMQKTLWFTHLLICCGIFVGTAVTFVPVILVTPSLDIFCDYSRACMQNLALRELASGFSALDINQFCRVHIEFTRYPCWMHPQTIFESYYLKKAIK